MKYILTFVLLFLINGITYSQVGDTVIIANAFTPELSTNNTFSPFINDDYTMFIYNRWGNLIYQGKSWDGKFNDNFCEQGVYIWNIRLSNGKNHYGTVSLIK